VINKQPGLVVHPGSGVYDNTLVNALLQHCGSSLSGIGGVARPGIVHRLDKDTSGIMVIAKNDFTHIGLTTQFSHAGSQNLHCYNLRTS
jgi:23S rRNA pseudouridine1911/1915/1917 synthase